MSTRVDPDSPLLHQVNLFTSPTSFSSSSSSFTFFLHFPSSRIIIGVKSRAIFDYWAADVRHLNWRFNHFQPPLEGVARRAAAPTGARPVPPRRKEGRWRGDARGDSVKPGSPVNCGRLNRRRRVKRRGGGDFGEASLLILGAELNWSELEINTIS